MMTCAWCLDMGMGQRFAEKYLEVRMVADPRDASGQIDGVYIDDINAISLYPLFAGRLPTFATSIRHGLIDRLNLGVFRERGCQGRGFARHQGLCGAQLHERLLHPRADAGRVIQTENVP